MSEGWTIVIHILMAEAIAISQARKSHILMHLYTELCFESLLEEFPIYSANELRISEVLIRGMASV